MTKATERDLHCMLLSLYAIGLNIEMAQRIRSNQPREVREADDKTIRQINQLIHEVRGMIRDVESSAVQEFDVSSDSY